MTEKPRQLQYASFFEALPGPLDHSKELNS